MHNQLFSRIIGPQPAPKRTPSATICGGCDSDAAAIADGRPFGADQWVIQLRCGECGSWQELVLSHAAMVRLERQLMSGWQAIERDLATLMHPDAS